MAGRPLKTEARRAAVDALRRGRPDPAPLHARPRSHRRDRQGRAPLAQPLRRPARAVLARRADAARGPQRPDDGHRRRLASAPRAAARRRRRRSTPRRAPATRSAGCSRPPRPHPAVFHLLLNELALLDARPGAAPPTPTSSRSASSCCSPPGLAPAARRPARPAASASTSSASRARRAAWSAPPCEAGAFALGEEAHAFMVDAIGRPLAEAPGGVGRARCARPTGRSRATVEHHAHLRLRPAARRVGSAGGVDEVGLRLLRGLARACATCSAARARTSPR